MNRGNKKPESMGKRNFRYKELFKFIVKCTPMVIVPAIVTALLALCDWIAPYPRTDSGGPSCSFDIITYLLGFAYGLGIINFACTLMASTHKAFERVGILPMLLTIISFDMLGTLLAYGNIEDTLHSPWTTIYLLITLLAFFIRYARYAYKVWHSSRSSKKK